MRGRDPTPREESGFACRATICSLNSNLSTNGQPPDAGEGFLPSDYSANSGPSCLLPRSPAAQARRGRRIYSLGAELGSTGNVGRLGELGLRRSQGPQPGMDCEPVQLRLPL